MGLIMSRFQKKKTTIEILDELDKKIKNIEEYGQSTEQKHKKIVGTLIIYSVALYITTAVIFYFYFFPAELYDQIFYMTPLLLFPILITFTYKAVSWYFRRKISRNLDKLTKMQQEKKKILDEVTEVETYKKAKEILMKYAPDQLRMTPLTPQSNTQAKQPITSPDSLKNTPQAVVSPLQGNMELRKRVFGTGGSNQNTLGPKFPSPASLAVTPNRKGIRSVNAITPAPKTPLPRPILPQKHSYVDRLVDYVVGDGPNNRYALICKQCDSHNGMALKEEFEYFARKQKPSAPKLNLDDSQIIRQKLSFEPSSSVDNLPLKDRNPDIVENPSNNDVHEDILDRQKSKAKQDPEISSEPIESRGMESKKEETDSNKMEVDESPIDVRGPI